MTHPAATAALTPEPDGSGVGAIADDIAETVFWAATQPPRVNINHLEVMPTTQAPGVLQVHRTT